MTEYKTIQKFNRTSRLWREVSAVAARRVLDGVMLVIDPSIGSDSSMPGYAVFVAGARTECGTIQVNPRASTHDRLYEIGLCLRTEFPAKIDVLVVEDIPTRRFNSYGRGSLKQQVQLHRAVGAVHASVAADHAVAVHPATWHSIVPEGYEKSDAADACAIGEVVRQYAIAVLANATTGMAGRGRKKKPEIQSK